MTWKGERGRHGMASRGINTKNNYKKDINNIPVHLPYQKRLDTNPPKKLIDLILSNNDGSHGEYEEFVPEIIHKHANLYDSTWAPFIKHNHVIWRQIK